MPSEIPPSPEREMSILRGLIKNHFRIEELTDHIESARNALLRALERNQVVDDLIEEFEKLTGEILDRQ